jgi:hypothetical protein
MSTFEPLSIAQAVDLLKSVKFADELRHLPKHVIAGMDVEIVPCMPPHQVAAIVSYVQNAIHIEGARRPPASPKTFSGCLSDVTFIGTSEDCGNGTYFNEYLESRRS